jgi:hypothetical protein
MTGIDGEPVNRRMITKSKKTNPEKKVNHGEYGEITGFRAGYRIVPGDPSILDCISRVRRV